LISAVAAVGENNNDELTGLHLASSPWSPTTYVCFD
jgi:hypothetical protein